MGSLPADHVRTMVRTTVHVLAIVMLARIIGLTDIAFAADSIAVSRSMVDTFSKDVVISLQDAGVFFTGPLHFSTSEWLYATGAASGSVLLMTTDAEIKRRVGRSQGQNLNNDFWDIPTYYGDALYAGGFAVVTYGVGLLSGDDDIRVTGRLLFESLSVSGGSAMLVRFVTGRSRPYGNNGQWDYKWFQTSDTYQSFPSGHAVVAFAVSTVLAERIDNVWARIGFYGMASLTAFARVYNNQHWASDVIAGAGLGLLGGFFVVRKEYEREHSAPVGSSRFQVQPTLDGIRLVYIVL